VRPAPESLESNELGTSPALNAGLVVFVLKFLKIFGLQEGFVYNTSIGILPQFEHFSHLLSVSKGL
jgi:hypothetical protein